MQSDRQQITAEYLLASLQTKVGVFVIATICAVGILVWGVTTYFMSPYGVSFSWWVWLLVPVWFVLFVVLVAFVVTMICFVTLSIWIEARRRSMFYRVLAIAVAIAVVTFMLGGMFNPLD